MKYLVLPIAVFLIGCGEKKDDLHNGYPVADNFHCTSSDEAICLEQFLNSLESWYGQTQFTTKECSLFPGFCVPGRALEGAYRGY